MLTNDWPTSLLLLTNDWPTCGSHGPSLNGYVGQRGASFPQPHTTTQMVRTWNPVLKETKYHHRHHRTFIYFITILFSLSLMFCYDDKWFDIHAHKSSLYILRQQTIAMAGIKFKHMTVAYSSTMR